MSESIQDLLTSPDGLIRAQKEPWLPELERFLCKHYKSDMLVMGNPLVHSIFPIPGFDNRRYRIMQEECRKAWHAKKWESWLWFHERPYRTQCLWNLIEGGKLSVDDARTGLLTMSVWIDCENIPQVQHIWYDLFHGIDGDLWMDDEDRAVLDKLPDEFRVWRGVCDDLHYSWTLSEKTAKFFADRPFNDSTGEVITRLVTKDEVYAYLIGRGEEEVLIVED